MNKSKGLIPCLAISLLCAGLVTLLSSTDIYQQLEYKLLDWRFRTAPQVPGASELVHIDIDDSSVEAIGRWPWPRTKIADLVEALSSVGAKYIVFDVLFIEPSDPTINPTVLQSVQEHTNSSVPSGNLLIQPDELLSQAITEAGNVYLPFYIDAHQYGLAEMVKLMEVTPFASVEDIKNQLHLDQNAVEKNYYAIQKSVIKKSIQQYLLENNKASLGQVIDALTHKYATSLPAHIQSWIQEAIQQFHEIQQYQKHYAFALNQPPSGIVIPSGGELVLPLVKLRKDLQGSGFVNSTYDTDGILRRSQLIWRYGNTYFFQNFFLALLRDLHVSPENIQIHDQMMEIPGAQLPGQTEATTIQIPVDATGHILLNWRQPFGQNFVHLPARALIQLTELKRQATSLQNTASGQATQLQAQASQLQARLKEYIQDKYCIIGNTTTGSTDLQVTPVSAVYPGVGSQSVLLNTILQQNFIRTVSQKINILIFFLFALSLGSFLTRLKPVKAAIFFVVYLAMMTVLYFYLFHYQGLWLQLSGVWLIGITSFLLITVYRYLTEEREKTWIRHAFQHYLSGNVIDEILEDPSKLMLGGQRKNLSVLFSDIRGFTSFSEKKSPEEVVRYLNEYLDAMTQIIFEFKGTLDKFVGDEIMVFFGAPGTQHASNHAEQAVRCAIAMQKRLLELQAQWIKEGRDILHAGIGINTGDMIVGNMGSTDRMDYTVIGDHVNLAARLCGHAKGHQILLSEMTAEQLPKNIAVKALSPIPVKGKSEPIAIFEVVLS